MPARAPTLKPQQYERKSLVDASGLAKRKTLLAACVRSFFNPSWFNISPHKNASRRCRAVCRRIPRLTPLQFRGKLLTAIRLEVVMSEPTYEELKAQLEALKKQSPAKRSGALEFRVGEKGGVSVYGLGRFPVTLYYEQWIRLLDIAGDLRTFLEENKSAGKLKLKES
jgi:hypothetical protein